ncbi:hypothetical protein K1719_011396 [Acacia pycnantha]|nr:hypothetical protein K1719_011396 [Acacia pycnantha]
MASQQYQHSVKTTTLFFKPIHSESLTDKLMIPRKFMKKYGDVFSETVFLKLPNGEEWKVNLGRRNNGDVWLQNGWREFAEHHSLFKGRLLVFEYDDSTSHRLNVIIMDLTTSEEIDYPSNHNVEAKRARNEQQEESPCGTRKNNKKCKGNIGRALERAKAFKSQYPFFMIVARPYYVNASSQVAIPSKFGIKFLASEKSGQSTNLRTSNGRVWITKFITRKQGTKTRFELSTSGWKPFVKDNDLKVDDVCVFELIKGPTHHELNFRVSIFRNMNNPSDNAPLSQSQAKRKHTVTSGQGQKNKRVKIKTKTEDLQVPPKKPKFTKATFSKESSAAHSFNSENPFFKVTIGKSQHAQAVPISFVRKYWEQGKHFAELQVRDRSWRVKLIITCCGSQEYGFFSEGWVAFLRENDLQKEDACFFELLNRNDFYVMKVSIFKRSLT